jgi:hypothetical protein
MKVSYTVWRLAWVGSEDVQLELNPSELLFVSAAPRQKETNAYLSYRIQNYSYKFSAISSGVLK